MGKKKRKEKKTHTTHDPLVLKSGKMVCWLTITIFYPKQFIKQYVETAEHELGVRRHGNHMGLTIEMPKSIKMHESSKSNRHSGGTTPSFSIAIQRERERWVLVGEVSQIWSTGELNSGEGHGRDRGQRRGEGKKKKEKRNRFALSVSSDKY